MNEKNQTHELQTLKIIVNTLLAGPTLFLAVVVLLTLVKEPGTADPRVSFTLFAACVVGVWMLSVYAINRVNRVFEPRLAGEDPLSAYRMLLIVRMAISEGAALVGLVGLLLFAPGGERPLYYRLLIFLLPYFSLLSTGVKCQPSEWDLQNRVRTAKESQARKHS